MTVKGLSMWQCPGCGLEVAARAIAVSHRCPSRHNKVVDWKPVVTAEAK